jgi:hypothetical protein
MSINIHEASVFPGRCDTQWNVKFFPTAAESRTSKQYADLILIPKATLNEKHTADQRKYFIDNCDMTAKFHNNKVRIDVNC